nr:hypothetical protein [Sulfurospirillum sp. 'SP']
MKQKHSKLDSFEQEIKHYLELGISIASIRLLLLPKLGGNIHLQTFYKFCNRKGYEKKVVE